MRCVALVIALITMGVTPAVAQDWYTFTPQASEVAFSIAEVSDRGPRIWLRWPGDPEVNLDETRFLIDVTCDPPSAVVLEARRFDAAGRETAREDVADTPLAEPWVAPVINAACHFRPTPVRAVILDPAITSASVRRAFLSGSDAEKARAVELVLSEPGAFTPLVFAHLAKELLALGRRDEALRWYLFGYTRMLVDVRAALSIDERYASSAGVFYFLYSSHTVDRELDRLDARQKEALRQAVLDEDAEIPRIYPVDWFLSVQTDEIAWGAPGALRPGTDFVMRDRLESARNEVRAARPE